MAETDDSDRLPQDVLSELGWENDPKKVADKVKCPALPCRHKGG